MPPLTEFLTTIKQLSLGEIIAIGGTMSAIASGIEEIADAINEIDDIDKVVKLSSSFEKVAKLRIENPGDLEKLSGYLQPEQSMGEKVAGFLGFQGGVTDFAGGMALVGEGGPELVALPGGSNVITNENTTKLLASASAGTQEKVDLQIAGLSQLISALNNNTAAVAKGGGGEGRKGVEAVKKDIILTLNNREFGRAVDARIEQKNDLRMG